METWLNEHLRGDRRSGAVRALLPRSDDLEGVAGMSRRTVRAARAWVGSPPRSVSSCPRIRRKCRSRRAVASASSERFPDSAGGLSLRNWPVVWSRIMLFTSRNSPGFPVSDRGSPSRSRVLSDRFRAPVRHRHRLARIRTVRMSMRRRALARSALMVAPAAQLAAAEPVAGAVLPARRRAGRCRSLFRWEIFA